MLVGILISHNGKGLRRKARFVPLKNSFPRGRRLIKPRGYFYLILFSAIFPLNILESL